ncbi:hypothetical protein JCM16303_003373 [Sporobolomyces ruberrimus]
MPAKRAQFSVHPSPSRSRKRRKTSTHPTRFYKPRTTTTDDPYVTESASPSEPEEETESEEENNRLSRSTSVKDSLSTLNQSTTNNPSFTSRTYLSTSTRPRKGLLRSRNLLGIKSTRPEENITQQTLRPRSRLRQRQRNSRPLSPLPVNNTLTRYRSSSAKRMAPIVNNKRSRDPSVRPTAIRITRRTSGALGPPNSGTATPDPKRKRSSGKLVESGSSEEEEDEEEDEQALEEVEMEPAQNSRSAMERGEGSQDEGEATETEGEGEDQTDALGSDATSKLREWPATKLRTLRRSELVDLFLALPSSSTSHPDTASMTKDSLISAITSARKPPSSALTEYPSSNEDDSADASPHPRTSHEPSPEDEIRPRRARTSQIATRSNGDRPQATKTRRSGSRKHPLTPPHTSGEEDNDEGMAVSDSGNGATSQQMGRRSSQIEMPPPPLPTVPTRQHRRTRSNATETEPSTAPNVLRFGKRLNHIIQEEEEGGANAAFTSPVAHRTRGHRPPSNVEQSNAAPRTIVANAFGSPARPGRAAKQKAVMRIKGKGKESDDEEDQEEEEEDAEDDDESMEVEEDSNVLVLSSDSEVGHDEVENGRRKNGQTRRRRSSRTTVKQVETPPSDADEESGGEEGQEVEVELRSNLRAAGKGARNGKVVRLRNGQQKSAREEGSDDDEPEDEPELGEEDGEDEDMEADYEEEEDQDEDELDLGNATSKSLLRCKKDDLVRLCKERDLENDGRTKKELVDALLQWRDQESYASSQDSDASTNSTLSNASTETARGATKTARLAKASHASRRTSKDTPLLMRAQHPVSPDKPRTVDCSKEREHQEDVNALDLESLQLQDKEIPPEKLTKLELVGSGGFKDVYKGTYRRRTIAICDIRGHLTDMDIKELGLLRDLRHENIVQFIGVSIPKPPSAVPVMIVTELCANGDLFDYIRGVEAPQFREILDIMLGIAKGIEYLHTRTPSIIHRDIKSSNVLITSHGVAKIADFGLARIKTSTKSMIRSLVGTVNWQAPELWHPHPRYNEKVDVYSVGLVMWEMLQWHQPVKRYPFEGMNEHAIYADVGQRQLRPSLAGLHRRWGGEIVELMGQMWDQEYSKRPSMPQVVRRLKQLLALEKAKSR